MKLNTGDLYMGGVTALCGMFSHWTAPNAADCAPDVVEGYSVKDYFDALGRYKGPDEHGVEPVFTDLSPMFHKPSLQLPMMLAGLALHNHGIPLGDVPDLGPLTSNERRKNKITRYDIDRMQAAVFKRGDRCGKKQRNQRRAAEGKGGAS